MASPGALHLMLACPGVGHVQRGYERATVALAGELRSEARVTLVRGGGSWSVDGSVRVPCLQRRGRVASRLHLHPLRAYGLEQRSFSLPLYALTRIMRPDVVHVHDPQVLTALWHARRLAGGRYPLLFTNGGWLGPEHLWRADHVHCLTPVDAERMRSAGHPPDRVHTVPYGVDLPAGCADLRGPGLRLIGVGALERAKGVHVAVEAAAAVAADGAPVSLTFLGQPTAESADLTTLARQRMGADATLLTVAPEQVTGHLLSANVFVLPTVSEGFGMAVLEAMAAGLPCLVSDLPVLRWLVGDAGVLLPPGEVGAWAAALRALHEPRRRALGARARERARELSWPSLRPAYLQMYRSVVAAGRR